MMEACSPSDAVYDDVSTILSSANQMSNLITALVDWTGVNSASAESNAEPVDIAAVCADAVRSRVGVTALRAQWCAL